MKDVMSAMDLYYMVQELQVLQNAKIMKIYEHDPDKNLLCLQVHVSGKGKFLVNIILPGLVYLAEQKFAFPKFPPGFCGFLRKYLNNARIREIRQVGFERILEFVIETLEGKFILIVELFSSGNVVLCHEDYKIKGLLYTQRWDSRTVRGGVTYDFPPALINPFTLTPNELSTLMQDSSLDLVRFCAIDLSLGGFYAERLLKILGAPKDAPTKNFDTQKLYDGLQKLLCEKASPCIFENQASPVLVDGWKSKESFSLALDSLFADKYEKEQFAHEEKTHQKQVSRYEKIVLEQNKQIENSEREIKINSAKGDAVYANYTGIASLLTQMKELRKKHSWEEIKEMYKEHPLLKNIDENKGLLTIEVE